MSMHAARAGFSRFCPRRVLAVGLAGLGVVMAAAQTLNIPRFYTPETTDLLPNLRRIITSPWSGLPFAFRDIAVSCTKMNNRGDFGGIVTETPEEDCFVRMQGEYLSLNAIFRRDLEGTSSPSARVNGVSVINDSGDVIGTTQGKWGQFHGNTRVFLLRNGTMVDLGVPDEEEFRHPSNAYFVLGQNGVLRLNNRGQVLVGDPSLRGSWLKDSPSGRWERLAPGTDWVARDLNDNGEVVGQFVGSKQGGIWAEGILREIPLNPGTASDGLNSPAFISKDGRIFWTSGHLTDRDGQVLAVLPIDKPALPGQDENIMVGCKMTAQNILRLGGPWLWRDGDWTGYDGLAGPAFMGFYPPIPNYASNLRLADIDDAGRLVHGWLGILKPSAPLILDQPHSLQVRAGRPAEFSITVAGALGHSWPPPLTMAGGWQRPSGGADGLATVETGDFVKLTNRLSIPVVGPQHAGDYWFVATNVSGVVTSTVVRLELLVPPSILGPPASVAGCPGSTVRLAVEAAGVPAPAYQWRFREQDLSGQTGAILELRDLAADAEGDYSVVVENSEGSVVSDPVRLSLLTAPSLRSVPPAQTVPSDSPAEFEVEAEGSAPLEFRWYHNGQPLPEVVGPKLLLPALSRSDAGDYTVTVANECGSVVSMPMSLAVLPRPPRLLDPRMLMGFDVAGEVGQAYRIEARPEGGPGEWTVIGRLTLAVSPQFFLDAESSVHPRRIYRAVVEP